MKKTMIILVIAVLVISLAIATSEIYKYKNKKVDGSTMTEIVNEVNKYKAECDKKKPDKCDKKITSNFEIEII